MASMDRQADGTVRADSETAVLFIADWDAPELTHSAPNALHWSKKFFMFRTVTVRLFSFKCVPVCL